MAAAARGLPLLALLVAIAATSARAEVTVNPGALELLPPPRPASPEPGTRPLGTRPPATRTPVTRPPGNHTPVANGSPTRTPATPSPTPSLPPAVVAPTPRPRIPDSPPAIAALPPPAPVPPPRPAPTPVVTITPDAPGVAGPLPKGVRVTFGPERTDLNPATEAALRDLARTLRNTPDTPINIYAYATGVPEDPSTARRVALGRALAARAVLITEGIPSTRIYPRALGPTGGDTAPDRVDVITGPPGPPPPEAPPTTPTLTTPALTSPTRTTPTR